MNDSQKDMLDFICKHPKVADAWTTTQGRLRGKYRVGKVGMSDIVGYMKDGRFLAVEKKRKGEVVSTEQQEFMDNILKCGGVAGVAITIEDAKNIIETPHTSPSSRLK